MTGERKRKRKADSYCEQGIGKKSSMAASVAMLFMKEARITTFRSKVQLLSSDQESSKSPDRKIVRYKVEETERKERGRSGFLYFFVASSVHHDNAFYLEKIRV